MRLAFLFFAIFFIVGCELPKIKTQDSQFESWGKTDKINWHPWNEATLKKAVNEKKLIYLTVGYGSCVTCENMQTNVLAKPEIAKILNRSFIAIRIDRELRPDLDAHFLNIQAGLMRYAAWPISMVLTPDLAPIFATTNMALPKFKNILTEAQKAWKDDPQKVKTQAGEFLTKIEPVENEEEFFSKTYELIKDHYARYTHQFDPIFGGRKVSPNFTPKFPVNDDMRLILRYHYRSKEPQPLKMVKKTMRSIAQSALNDRQNGGFYRYSSQRNWNRPHPEKLLTDQASFLNAYIDIYNWSNTSQYSRLIEFTRDSLLKKWWASWGGFYSSKNSVEKGNIDTTVVTASTAHLFSALARSQRQLPFKGGFKGIEKKFHRFLEQHSHRDGHLYHGSVSGSVSSDITLDDYVFTIDALIEFYQTTFDEAYLLKAMKLQELQNKLLWQKDKGLYRFSLGTESFLNDQFLFRDQGKPSGLSQSYFNLARLSRYFENRNFSQTQRLIIDNFPDLLKLDPLAFSSLLLGLDFELAPGKTLILYGRPSDCQTMRKDFEKHYHPYVIFSCFNKDSTIPLHKGRKLADGKNYQICGTDSCEPTEKDLKIIQEQLRVTNLE